MRICMVTNTYLPHVGGVANSVATFVGEYERCGHAVLVIAPTFPGTEDEDRPDVVRVPAIQNFNGSDFSVRKPAPYLVRRRLESFQPDILHSHHPFLLGDTALRMAYERNLPLIFTHHTLYEQYTHYVPFDSEPLKRFVIELSTDYANLCDAVVAPSGSVAQLLKERGVTAPVHVIPTGIDVDAYGRGDRSGFRQRYRIAQDALLIGHLGRLAMEKNLGYLARAMIRFLAREPRAQFLLVGSGNYESQVRAMFAHAGLSDRLVCTGPLTGGDVADAYAAMDAFVFASQSETQGMVVTEAMAAGNPVVALDGPGVREVVEDGINGRLLAGSASEQRFAEAIAEQCQPIVLDERGRAAVDTARHFSKERSAERMLALYESVIAAHTAQEEQDWSLWDRLLGRLEIEWNLITGKTSAAAAAMTHRDGSEPRLE